MARVVNEVHMYVCRGHVPEQVHVRVEMLDTKTLEQDDDGHLVGEVTVFESDAISIMDGCQSVVSFLEQFEREEAVHMVQERKNNG